MTTWNHYHTPASVDEALKLLSDYDGQARVVGGGTDLLLDMQQGHHPPVEALVDVTRIEGLAQIRQNDDKVTIGAGVTHTQIVESDTLVAGATCLVESCGVVGGPQVRNVGTLGGNVAHALPAADGTTSLVALDAQVEIAQGGERRWVHILEMFKGPGQSLIDSTRDLLLNFRFRLCAPGEATAFKRIMRPQGVALPVLGCAVWVRLNDGQTIDDTRVCISPVAPTPVRVSPIEEILRGASVGDENALQATLDTACETARGELHPRTSKYRATAEYRIEMADTLLRRALKLAVTRAQTGEAVPEGVGLQ
jgi:carbon-monoxide dehydrogenase medium subunit